MEFQSWLAFLGASIVISFAPGPDNIFVLMQSVIYGKKAGLKIISGLCSGLLIHTILVTVGISGLIRASATAFFALKVVGCVYLVYLAYLAWTAPTMILAEEDSSSVPQEMSSFAWWRRGLIMNLTNPKVIIFFLAFFPQFLSDTRNHAVQMIIMGLTFIAATIFVFGLVAVFAELVRKLVSTSRVQKIINRTGAVIFVLLAANLFFTS